MTLSAHDVAIIIPVYAQCAEHVKYVAECLESTQGQAGEVILWNDGSPGGYTQQIYRLLRRFPWVQATYADHRGKSAARNGAVRQTTRSMIYPLDADDILKPGAVDTLVGAWDGTPLYSDLVKLHEGGVREPYPLPSFDCTRMQQQCVASVNVLHSKEQWELAGGWDESVNLMEDWEYNARLFWLFCGRRVAQQLVEYRIYPEQHTRRVSRQSRFEADARVRQMITEYVGRTDMACCGKKRSPTTPATRSAPAPVTRSPGLLTADSVPRTVGADLTADLAALGDPGPGNVWAMYLGGRGMGPHGRKGIRSRRRYARVSYGGIYAVRGEDAVSREQFEAGARHGDFVQVRQRRPPPPPTPPPPLTPSPSTPQVARTPVRVEREAVSDDAMASYTEAMETMTLRELKALLDQIDFGPDELQNLINAERGSKNRIGAVKLLEKQLANTA